MSTLTRFLEKWASLTLDQKNALVAEVNFGLKLRKIGEQWQWWREPRDVPGTWENVAPCDDYCRNWAAAMSVRLALKARHWHSSDTLDAHGYTITFVGARGQSGGESLSATTADPNDAPEVISRTSTLLTLCAAGRLTAWLKAPAHSDTVYVRMQEEFCVKVRALLDDLGDNPDVIALRLGCKGAKGDRLQTDSNALATYVARELGAGAHAWVTEQQITVQVPNTPHPGAFAFPVSRTVAQFVFRYDVGMYPDLLS